MRIVVNIEDINIENLSSSLGVTIEETEMLARSVVLDSIERLEVDEQLEREMKQELEFKRSNNLPILREIGKGDSTDKLEVLLFDNIKQAIKDTIGDVYRGRVSEKQLEAFTKACIATDVPEVIDEPCRR